MATRKRSKKSVIEHDPLAAAEEEQLVETEKPETVEEEPPVEAAKQEAVEAEPEVEVAETAADSATVFTFEDSLTISDVADLHQSLTEALSETGEIRLDGSEIRQADGAGMQLLAGFAQEAVKLHVPFKWLGASEELCEAATQLGLAKTLQLDEVNEAA